APVLCSTLPVEKIPQLDSFTLSPSRYPCAVHARPPAFQQYHTAAQARRPSTTVPTCKPTRLLSLACHYSASSTPFCALTNFSLFFGAPSHFVNWSDFSHRRKPDHTPSVPPTSRSE